MIFRFKIFYFLFKFMFSILIQKYTSDFSKLGKGLQKYLHHLRKSKYGNLMVGVVFGASELLNATISAGLDISIFDMEVDYYFIQLNLLNECTKELRSGFAPLSGTGNTTTLEMLAIKLKELKIKKEKTYFVYGLYPWSVDAHKLSYADTVCQMTYETMCKDPNKTKDWCADTSHTYREKGKFAFEHSVGFGVECVDLNDVDQVCNCSTPVPGFHYILDGWYGKTDYPECPLFDRITP